MNKRSSEELLSLVKKRNDLFVKFRNINDRELDQVRSGDFSNLKVFYDERSVLLSSVSKLDSSIRSFSKHPVAKPVKNDVRVNLLNALDKKEELVREILEQDLEIIHLVDEHQLNLENQHSKSA